MQNNSRKNGLSCSERYRLNTSLKWRKYLFFVQVHALSTEGLHNPVNMDESENQNHRSDTQLFPLIKRLFCASSFPPCVSFVYLNPSDEVYITLLLHISKALD